MSLCGLSCAPDGAVPCRAEPYRAVPCRSDRRRWSVVWEGSVGPLSRRTATTTGLSGRPTTGPARVAAWGSLRRQPGLGRKIELGTILEDRAWSGVGEGTRGG